MDYPAVQEEFTIWAAPLHSCKWKAGHKSAMGLIWLMDHELDYARSDKQNSKQEI